MSIIAWNEASTIDLAIKSIKDFADEIILVDNNSTDDTVEIARENFEKYGLNAKVFEKVLPLKGARDYAFKQCTSDWICIVDADHVLNTTSNSPNVKDLRALAEKGGEKAYSFTYFHMYGDFRHLDKSRVLADIHPVLFRNISKKIQVGGKRRWNNPVFHYEEVINKKVIGVNLAGQKPAWRLYVRQFYGQWHKRGHKYANPLEFMVKTRRITNIHKIADAWLLERLKNNTVKIEKGKTISRRIKLLKNKYNMSFQFDRGVEHLPQVVQEELKHPRYELIYENGQIVGRNPDLLPRG